MFEFFTAKSAEALNVHEFTYFLFSYTFILMLNCNFLPDQIDFFLLLVPEVSDWHCVWLHVGWGSGSGFVRSVAPALPQV